MGEAEVLTADYIRELEQKYVVHTYSRSPFVLDHGEGMWVYDTEGKRYLDFLGGIAVNALGHRHPAILEAIEKQSAKLLHVSNLYHSAPHALLARDLVESSAADRVYFCNSGTEAIEACIKFARKWGKANGGKSAFISFEHSFHGRTMGALALTAKARYQEPFAPVMPGAYYAPFNDLEATRKLMAEVRPCAVFIEVVQGEGGVYLASDSFMQGLRTACDEYGALLVCDEVQCGMGRTGTLWAYEHSGIRPDMIAVAKPIGGGLPMGVAMVTEKVASLLEPGDHGSTFAANPLICTVARAVLSTINTPEFLANVRDKGGYLGEALSGLVEKHRCVSEIRGRGLIWGLEMSLDARNVVAAGYEEGLIVGMAGEHVVRLLPPLIAQEAEIDQAVSILDGILGKLAVSG